jgi:hypothetical protein
MTRLSATTDEMAGKIIKPDLSETPQEVQITKLPHARTAM